MTTPSDRGLAFAKEFDNTCISGGTYAERMAVIAKLFDAYHLSPRHSAPNNLPELVREFIALLEVVEESDTGREFHPNQIASCRVMDSKRLDELIVLMKAAAV